MNLFSLAERVAALDVPPIRLTADRCLHARSKFVTCDACVGACPTGALKRNGSIALKDEECVVCGQCLHACPTGAFEGDDGVADLFSCVARLETRETLDLVCPQHPSAGKGSADTTAVIRTNNCLAAVGASAYLGLAVLGVKQVAVRLEACAACPLGKVQSEITHTLSIARRLLGAIGSEVCITETTRPLEFKERPVIDTKHQELSRRDLFRMFAAKGPRQIGRVLTGDDDQPSTESRSVSREQRRLINMLRNLSLTHSTALLSGLPFAQLTIDDHCTACGVCARICPTGALTFTTSESDAYSLAFSSSACIDCGLCGGLCDSEALQRIDATVGNVMALEPVMLRTGQLQVCTQCRAKFAAELPGDLCPPCDFKRTHPTEVRLPPLLRKRGLPAIKNKAAAPAAALQT